MIIPVECFTCNFPFLSHRWDMYVEKVKEYRKEDGKTEMEYLTATTTKTAEGKALDDLKITKPCCRRHMLSHVDLI